MSLQTHPMLAIDTATNRIVVAATTPDGREVDESFEGRYRHSQELLPAIIRVLDKAGVRPADLRGIVVGLGPGAFTGLRVGLAAAKTLAHELGIPIVGVPTSEALLTGVPGVQEVWLPSGPRQRIVMRAGSDPTTVPQGAPGSTEGVAAIDLDGRAPEAATELGQRAMEALAGRLLLLGDVRFQRQERDDPERLVPLYASVPRGVAVDATADESGGGVAWSRDPR